MTPTRRNYLQAASLTGVASLSGCLGIDSIIADGDSSSDSDTPDDADEESPQDESGESETPVIASRTETLTEYLDWLVTEYDDLRSSYEIKVRSVYQEISEIDDTDTESVTLDALDSVSDSINGLGSYAEDLFSPHYTTHYGFGSVADQLQSEARPALRRGEYEIANREIRRAKRYVGNAMNEQTLRRFYPRYLIHQDPYVYFTKHDDKDSVVANRIFEVYYTGSEDSTGLFAAPGRMNIKQHPFGEPLPTDQFDSAATNPDRDSDVFTLSSWLSDERANSEVFLNVIDYSLMSGNYPDTYLLNRGRGASEIDDVSELSTPDFNEAESVLVQIQQFDDEHTASRVVEDITDRGEVDGTETYYETEYDQVFYSHSELAETVYADVAQAGSVVICLDLHRTQWPDRYDQDEFDSNSDRVSSLLESTIFDTESESDS